MIHFDLPKIETRINELEIQMQDNNFWNDAKKSSEVLTESKRLKSKLEKYNKLNQDIQNLEDLNELLLSENDEEMAKEVLKDTSRLEKEIETLEIDTLLSGKYDKNNAIFTLHPGAGGTESQDWAEMLYRMYSKWANSKGFKVKELDYLEGEEAGLKSVTVLIEGENAYGYLKGEMGVHRLVRISPFDSGGRRHTSFASLEVLPEMEDVDIYKS